jgi:protein-L-isoaspartate O-methyltransferase
MDSGALPRALPPLWRLGPVPGAAIELGAGTGFLAAVLAQLGADVIATDMGDEGTTRRQRRTPLGRLTANLALSG